MNYNIMTILGDAIVGVLALKWVFTDSPIRVLHFGIKAKWSYQTRQYVWVNWDLGNCLPADCCFRELVRKRSGYLCGSRSKKS